MSKLSVVAGISIRDDGTRKRLLLIQRRDDQKYPGAWCCPGGKKEENEDGQHATLREFHEELNAYYDDVGVEENPCFSAQTEEANVSYYMLNVGYPERITYDEDHAQGMGWFSTAELSALSLTPGDDQIRHKLQELLEA